MPERSESEYPSILTIAVVAWAKVSGSFGWNLLSAIGVMYFFFTAQLTYPQSVVFGFISGY